MLTKLCFPYNVVFNRVKKARFWNIPFSIMIYKHALFGIQGDISIRFFVYLPTVPIALFNTPYYVPREKENISSQDRRVMRSCDEHCMHGMLKSCLISLGMSRAPCPLPTFRQYFSQRHCLPAWGNECIIWYPISDIISRSLSHVILWWTQCGWQDVVIAEIIWARQPFNDTAFTPKAMNTNDVH